MSELLVDFITSLDGYGAADGWPGWWGLAGTGVPRVVGRRPAGGRLHGPDGREHLPAHVASLAADGEPGTDALAGMSKIVFSSTLSEPLVVAEHAARRPGRRRGRARA